MLDLWGITLGSGCSPEPTEPRLVLHQEGAVQVDRVGEVEMPEILLDNGSHPHGLDCSTDRPQVANAEGNRIFALAAGTTIVRCAWEDQAITFPLEVQLATVLAFVQAPSEVRVGYEARLQLEALHGERRLPLGKVRWESSNPAVAQVAGGRIRGYRPGVAYVTAQARGATAQLQIRVIP